MYEYHPVEPQTGQDFFRFSDVFILEGIVPALLCCSCLWPLPPFPECRICISASPAVCSKLFKVGVAERYRVRTICSLSCAKQKAWSMVVHELLWSSLLNLNCLPKCTASMLRSAKWTHPINATKQVQPLPSLPFCWPFFLCIYIPAAAHLIDWAPLLLSRGASIDHNLLSFHATLLNTGFC